MLAILAADPNRRLVENTVAEMGWWDCFRKDRAMDRAHADSDYDTNPGTPSQFKRTTPKTGRNEPCPCGSGKKYKKCCGG